MTEVAQECKVRLAPVSPGVASCLSFEVSPRCLGSSEAPGAPLTSLVSCLCRPPAHDMGSGGPRTTDLGWPLHAGHPQNHSSLRPPGCCLLCVCDKSRGQSMLRPSQAAMRPRGLGGMAVGSLGVLDVPGTAGGQLLPSDDL